jgi:diguanylate cyclase (GGDEF)-like protein
MIRYAIKKLSHGIQSRLLAVLVAFGLTLILGGAVAAYLIVEKERVHVSNVALESVRSVATANALVTRLMIHSVDLGLESLASNFAQDIPQSQWGENSVHQMLNAHLSIIAEANALFLIGADGKFINSSFVYPPPPLDLSDREYFQYHRNNQNPSLHVGKPLRNRSSGAWFIDLSRPIHGPNGEFLGVLLAAIPPSYFSDRFREIAIGSIQTMILFHADGTILSRYPYREDVLGKKLEKRTPLVQDIVGGGSDAIIRDLSQVENIPRIIAFHKVPGFPLVASVGGSEVDALKEWKHTASLIWNGVIVSSIVTLVFAIIIVRLFRQQQFFIRELDNMSKHDALTGIGNRRMFDEALEAEWRRSARSASPVGLLMIDIDFFKSYNDHYGHVHGDECLREIAEALAENVRRAPDMIARFGGEEFVCLLPATEISGVSQMAEALLKSVRDKRLPHGFSSVDNIVTISLGGTVMIPASDNSPIDLIAAADHLLYEAKKLRPQSGSGSSHYFPPQGIMGTVEMEFFGEPSMMRSE